MTDTPPGGRGPLAGRSGPDASGPHDDLAGFVLGTLDRAEEAAFEAHLAGCSSCRAEAAELSDLGRPFRSPGPPVPLPAGLEQRTLAAVRSAATAPASQPQEPGPRIVTPLRPGRRRFALALVSAAAAAAVVTAGTVVSVDRWRGQNDGGPVAARFVLAKGETGSGSGSAVVRQASTGLRVELAVSGLAPNPPGTVYECWFVGPGDTLDKPNRISAGTFTVGSGGTAEVVTASAADLARFPNLGVTLEPTDGNPARTGPKALVTQR